MSLILTLFAEVNAKDAVKDPVSHQGCLLILLAHASFFSSRKRFRKADKKPAAQTMKKNKKITREKKIFASRPNTAETYIR